MKERETIINGYLEMEKNEIPCKKWWWNFNKKVASYQQLITTDFSKYHHFGIPQKLIYSFYQDQTRI